jgi:hypothetical protein
MLKISRVEPPHLPATLRFEGKLVGPWVAEARQVCERLLGAGHELKLDLAEVEFVDPAGLTLLGLLQARGVSLIHCSPFVAEQLKAPPLLQ